MFSLTANDYDVIGSVVAYKTDLAELDRAVEQFLAVPLKTHLYIIDNSTTPIAEGRYKQPGVSYHFASANLGYGTAHNLAIRAALGHARCSLVMNTDIVYTPEVVLRLFHLMQEQQEVGLAAPQIRYPDGSLQYVCRLLPTPANLFLRRFLPHSSWTKRADAQYELRWWDHRSIANIPYFQGSFVMLRTQLCNELGGFDERFFLYGEDIDLTRRIHQVAATLYVPDVHITHEYRRYSNRSLRGTWIGIQNNVRYFNKWGWFLDAERRQINSRTVNALRAQADGNQVFTA
jgi:GT2 family glycosyltransferase